MKNIFLILIALSFCISCKKDKPAENDATATVATKDEHEDHDHEGHDHSTHIKADPTAFLMGKWQYEIALATDEPEKYKDRWIQFNQDNSFISGVGNKQTNHGTFTYVLNPRKILTIEYNEPETIPFQWEIQGSHDVIIWKGNTPMNPAGVQVKMNKMEEE